MNRELYKNSLTGHIPEELGKLKVSDFLQLINRELYLLPVFKSCHYNDVKRLTDLCIGGFCCIVEVARELGLVPQQFYRLYSPLSWEAEQLGISVSYFYHVLGLGFCKWFGNLRKSLGLNARFNSGEIVYFVLMNVQTLVFSFLKCTPQDSYEILILNTDVSIVTS